ncbi:MAG: protein kinase [Dehalococcoidia bacterium]|jgi:serine/threonine-protein kinase|nr:protein kinase [Dehalococcoidia bacterium]
MKLEAGAKVGPYQIEAKLGGGGMGVVYRAMDTRLDRPVALKFLPPDLTRDDAAKARFVQEAKAASALDHQNICTIHEIGETDDGQLYLVMACYDGATLKERIDDGALTAADALDIAIQAVEGLVEAHRAGMVHRDIKPANLMVTSSGLVKILDFGLAKLVGSEGITQTGMAMGTVAYMSPEQLQGHEVDQRTDIWSLGVVAYEMVTGERPFKGEQLQAVSLGVLQQEPTAVTSVRAGVPAEVERVVARALSKRREDRYQTSADLLSELRGVKRALDSGSAAARTADATPSIAVLPFASMSADPENEFFADGITEDIINALTQLDGLRVAARTSAFSFKGKSPDISEVAAKLKVKTVLEGSVRRAGNRLRVTAQLINAADGYQIWSERYDRDLEDVFAIQDEIATKIAERLKVTLTGPADAPLVKPQTDNLEAYQLYVKGRASLYRRGRGIARALDCFKQSVTLDPNYALAWAGLADAQTTLGFYGMEPPADVFPKAKEAAVRAVALDPDLAEGHNAMACIALVFDRDWSTSEREFQRALELNPSYVQARCWYAFFYLQIVAGRTGEGVAEARRALESDPLSAYATSLYALSLGMAGDYPAAVEQGQLAVERDPESYVAWWTLQMCFLWDSRFAESVPSGETALAISGRHSYALVTLLFTYAEWGKPAEARALYDELQARAGREHLPPSALASAAASVGDLDDVLPLVERAYADRDTYLLFAPRMALAGAFLAVPGVRDVIRRFDLPDGFPLAEVDPD